MRKNTYGFSCCFWRRRSRSVPGPKSLVSCVGNFAATFSEVLPSEPTKLRARYLKKHPQELNIAVFGPWDYYARQGFILDKAVQLAIDEVNAAAEFSDARVNPVWVDNGNYSAIAQEQAEKLAADPSIFCSARAGHVGAGAAVQLPVRGCRVAGGGAAGPERADQPRQNQCAAVHADRFRPGRKQGAGSLGGEGETEQFSDSERRQPFPDELRQLCGAVIL